MGSGETAYPGNHQDEETKAYWLFEGRMQNGKWRTRSEGSPRVQKGKLPQEDGRGHQTGSARKTRPVGAQNQWGRSLERLEGRTPEIKRKGVKKVERKKTDKTPYGGVQKKLPGVRALRKLERGERTR